MVVYLYGGPLFLAKMLPVSKLNSIFIREVIDATRDSITFSGGKVISIILMEIEQTKVVCEVMILFQVNPGSLQMGSFDFLILSTY